MTNENAFSPNTMCDAVCETLDLAYEVMGTLEEEFGAFFSETKSGDVEVAAVTAIHCILTRNLAPATNLEVLSTFTTEVVSLFDEAASKKWFAEVALEWLDKQSGGHGINRNNECLAPLCSDVDGVDAEMDLGSQIQAAGEVESILIKFSGPVGEPVLAT